MKPGKRRPQTPYANNNNNNENEEKYCTKKEQTRDTRVQINEEIGKVPEEEFRILIVKMIQNLENKMKKRQDSINKDIEELKNKHTGKSNTITEI